MGCMGETFYCLCYSHLGRNVMTEGNCVVVTMRQ